MIQCCTKQDWLPTCPSLTDSWRQLDALNQELSTLTEEAVKFEKKQRKYDDVADNVSETLFAPAFATHSKARGFMTSQASKQKQSRMHESWKIYEDMHHDLNKIIYIVSFSLQEGRGYAR